MYAKNAKPSPLLKSSANFKNRDYFILFMETKNNLNNLTQEQVWDKIAPLWNRDKKVPFGSNFDDNIFFGFIDKKDKKILDLGCGSGRNFPSIINSGFSGELYGVDFSGEMLKFAKENAKQLDLKCKIFKSKVSKLEFEDNFFDKVVCIATIHCIETKKERNNTIKEMYRVLKLKGKLLITTWNKDSERWKNKPKEKYVSWNLKEGGDDIEEGKVWRHYYLYNQDELASDLEKAGFKILKKNNPLARNIVIIAEK